MRVRLRTAGKKGWMARAESTNGNYDASGGMGSLERPLSVMERTAYFETLYTPKTRQDFYSFKDSKDKKIEAKENEIPEAEEVPEVVSPKRTPPAKPKRTFAYDRELLRQSTMENAAQEEVLCTEAETLQPTQALNYASHVQEKLLENATSNGSPPPIAPKPSLIPDRPSVLIQDSHAMERELQFETRELESETEKSIDEISATSHSPLKRTSNYTQSNGRSGSASGFVSRVSRDHLMRTESVSESTKNLDVDKTEQGYLASKLKRCVTRAKLVRRRTLALYNQQEVAFCKRMSPQLFDRAINIRLVPRSDFSVTLYDGIDSLYLPIVAYKYPEENGDDADNSPVDCADLFIPDFTKARPYQDYEQWPGNEEFMLTLTDSLGKRSFAYCIKYLRRRRDEDLDKASTSAEGCLPEVFAIISPIHAPPFYSALARECVVYIERGRGTLNNFLDAIFRRPFPSKGGVLRLIENTGSETKREFMIRSQGPAIGRADSSAVIKRVGVEVSVSIIAALFSEQKVLIGGDSVQSVTHAVQTFASLLQPFSWPYTLVPVLPDTLLELANSPTPCLLGVLRNNLYKLKQLLVGSRQCDANDLLQDDVVIVDLDGGIFVPHPAELFVASQHSDFMEKSAIALCEKLLLPKKLAMNLISSFKEALSGGVGPHADELLQKAMLIWFASLLGHYKGYNLENAYLADLKGDQEPLRIALSQFVSAHPSKTSRRFVEWFVETGLFRDWLRRKATASKDENERIIGTCEDGANQRFDEFALALSTASTQGRFSSIFSRASTALFRTHILKKL